MNWTYLAWSHENLMNCQADPVWVRRSSAEEEWGASSWGLGKVFAKQEHLLPWESDMRSSSSSSLPWHFINLNSDSTPTPDACTLHPLKIIIYELFKICITNSPFYQDFASQKKNPTQAPQSKIPRIYYKICMYIKNINFPNLISTKTKEIKLIQRKSLCWTLLEIIIL